MPRPRRDGAAPRRANKRKLNELYIRHLRGKPQDHPFLVWDQTQPGLVLSVRRSGVLTYKAVYRHHGRLRWYTMDKGISLAAAREKARDVRDRAFKGEDPHADDKGGRQNFITFEKLASLYVEEHSKKKNRSWEQADSLVKKNLLRRLGKREARDITTTDVEDALKDKAPMIFNQILAAASAIFNWAIKEEKKPRGIKTGVRDNPCKDIVRNDTKSRERRLWDSEVPKFWSEFDGGAADGEAPQAGSRPVVTYVTGAMLKMILLTGQRPGEVSHMRYEHIVDGGWWQMPAEPVPALGWPGTKNKESHRVWLPEPARELITGMAEASGADMKSGLVFPAPRGGPVSRTVPAHAMKLICKKLGVERATPHDLRRTHGTTITGLRFGRDAMNRIQNHKEGGIADTYDRHGYDEENKEIMEAVAKRVMSLVEGNGSDNVVPLRHRVG